MQKQSIMGIAPEVPPCEMSLEELLLHALVMEREAVHRYEELSKMMDSIGNSKVARIFAKMSKIDWWLETKIWGAEMLTLSMPETDVVTPAAHSSVRPQYRCTQSCRLAGARTSPPRIDTAEKNAVAGTVTIQNQTVRSTPQASAEK